MTESYSKALIRSPQVIYKVVEGGEKSISNLTLPSFVQRESSLTPCGPSALLLEPVKGSTFLWAEVLSACGPVMGLKRTLT